MNVEQTLNAIELCIKSPMKAEEKSVYLKPLFSHLLMLVASTGETVVFDVNSLYPSIGKPGYKGGLTFLQKKEGEC